MLGKVKLTLIEKFNLFLNKIRTDNYHIKPNYITNWFARPYLDNEEYASTYQVEVYKHARNLIKQKKLRSVIDVGCGHAVKLDTYIVPVTNDVTGVDTPHSIEFCKKTYDFGTWVIDDITQPYFDYEQKYDLVLSVDVIEHLPDPSDLIHYLKKLSHENSVVIISTPERDLVRGKDDMGPPQNPAHVREWNKKELAAFLKSEGMIIHEHLIVKAMKKKTNKATCQMVVGSFT